MSQSIDKRIVEMVFDNDQFEKGIKTTTQSLNNLNKSLQLEDSTQGFANITKAASNVNLNSIVNGVEALQNRFSTFGIVGMRVIENLTDTAMSLASKAFSYIGDKVIGGGIKRAMNIENAHFLLQGLIDDEKEVQAIMADAMDSVDGTAFAYDEAAKAAASFAATGMRSGEQLQSTLRAVAGTAATANVEYDRVAHLFQTVSGQGRVMGDQLNQFATMGLNAAATIANYLGTTEAEVREMVSKGKIDFETFAAAMDDAFGEHAKKANETFTGAMANIGAALARIGAKFVSPLVEQNGAIVMMFNAIRERVNDINKTMDPFASLFVNRVTQIVKSITEWLKKSDLQTKITKKMAGVFRVFSNSLYILENIMTGLGTIMKPISEAIKSFIPDDLLNKTANFLVKIRQLTSKFRLSDKDATNLRDTIKGIVSVFQILGQVIKAVLENIFPLTRGVNGLGSSFLEVTGNIGRFLESLNATLKETGVFEAIGLSIKKAIDVISNQIKNLISIFKNLFSSVDVGKIKFGEFFNKIKEVFEDFADKNFNSIGDVLKLFIEGGFVVVLTKIASGFFRINKAVRKSTKAISGVVNAIADFKNALQALTITAKSKSLTHFLEEILRYKRKNAQIFRISMLLMSLAISIRLLAQSVKEIGEMDTVSLAKGMVSLGVLIFALFTMISILSNANRVTSISSKNLLAFAVVLAAMSLSIKILASAMEDIGKLRLDQAAQGFVAVFLMVAEMTAAMVAMATVLQSVNPVGLIAAAASMLVLSGVIVILSKVITNLKDVTFGEMISVAAGITAFVAALGVVAWALGQPEVWAYAMAGALAILAIGGAISAIAYIFSLSVPTFVKAINDLAGIDANGLKETLKALAEGFALLAASMFALGFGNLLGGGFIMLGLVAALKVLTPELVELSKIPSRTLRDVFAQLAEGFIMLGAALKTYNFLISGVASKAILRLSLAIQNMTPALSELTDIDEHKIVSTMEALSIGFTELGEALKGFVNPFKSINGSLTLKSLTDTISKLTPALIGLQEVGGDKIKEIMVSVAEGFKELAVAMNEFQDDKALKDISGAFTISKLVKTMRGLSEALSSLNNVGTLSIKTTLSAVAEGFKALGEAMDVFQDNKILKNVSGRNTLDSLADTINKLADPLVRLSSNVKGGAGIEEALKALANGFDALGQSMDSYHWYDDLKTDAIGELANTIDVLVPSLIELCKPGFDALKISNVLTAIGNGFKSFGEAINECGLFGAEQGANGISTLVSTIDTLTTSIPAAVTALGNGSEARELMENIGYGFKGFGESLKSSPLFNADEKGMGIAAVNESLPKFVEGIKSFMGLADDTGSYEDAEEVIGIIGSSIMDFGSSINECGLFGSGKNAEALSSLIDTLPQLAKSVKDLASAEKLTGTVGTILSDLGTAMYDFAMAIRKASPFWGAEAKANSIATLMDGISKLPGPLKEMAALNSVQVVAVFKQLQNGLTGFAEAIKASGFWGVEDKANSLTSVVNSIDILVPCIERLINLKNNSEVAFSVQGMLEGFATGISSLGDALQKFNYAQDAVGPLNSMIDAVGKLVGYIEELGGTDVASLGWSIAGFFEDIFSVVNSDIGIKFQELGSSMISHIITGMSLKRVEATTTANVIATAVVTKFKEIMTYKVFHDDLGAKSITSLKGGMNFAAVTGGGLYETASSIANVVVNTFKDAITYQTFYDIGSNAVQGLIEGLKSKEKEVNDIASKIANTVATAMASAKGLDERSPSKKTRQIGAYAGEGLALGLLDTADRIKESSETVSQEALDVMKDSISQISDIVNNAIDPDPTIKPIIDLDEAKKNVDTLNSMFNDGLNLSTSYNKAIQSAGTLANNNTASAPVQDAQNQQPSNYNFIQNNYSPKALPRVEIYRQTKNQFSQFRKAVEGV